MRFRLEQLALLFAVTLFSCSAATDPHEDPRPEVSAARFACWTWYPERPPVERALMDIYFGRRTPEDPTDRPSDESLATIVELGGTVVHSFNVPMARAILAVDAVPDLSANYVVTVTDEKIFNLRASIGIDTPLSAEERAFLEGLGVFAIEEYKLFVVAVVPDGAIPAIREQLDADYVSPDGIACPAELQGTE